MEFQQKQISRRAALQIGAALAGSTLLAACSAPAAPAPPKPAESKPAPAAPAAKEAAPAKKALAGQLVFMNGIASHSKLATDWAEKFQAANSGVKVDVKFIASGQDMQNQLLVQTAAGAPPDVFTYFQEIMPITAAVEKNVLMPLDDYIKADNLDMSDFLPQALEINKWEGKSYGLPRDYGNQQVYYNADLFKKKGLALPGTDWTDTSWSFEKYLDAARALTESSGGQQTQFGVLINTAWRPWATFVYCNGGKIVNQDARGVATSFAIAEEPAIEALQFLQDLIYKHKVAPPPSGTSAWSPDLGPVEIFGTNKVGMLIGNPSQAQNYRKITAFAWDVAPPPVGKGGKRGTGGGGTAWSIARSTKNTDAAWAFLKFITSAEAQQDEVAIGATTPSRKSVVTSKQFQNPELAPKNAKSFAEAQTYVIRDPVNVAWPDIFQKVVAPNMQLLWAGKEDARTIATRIKEEGDKMWAKN